MNQEKVLSVLLGPIVSEKTTLATANNQYVFKVRTDSNKREISAAVEELFGVTVEAVTTSNVKGKKKIYRGKAGRGACSLPNSPLCISSPTSSSLLLSIVRLIIIIFSCHSHPQHCWLPMFSFGVHCMCCFRFEISTVYLPAGRLRCPIPTQACHGTPEDRERSA